MSRNFVLAFIFTGIIFRVVPSPTPTTSPQRVFSVVSPTPTPALNPQLIRKLEVITPSPVLRRKPVPSPTATPKFVLLSTPSPTPPPATFSAIIAAARDLGEITNSETASEAGQQFYIFQVKEKLKLFGIIPVFDHVVFTVEKDNHQLRKVNRPWWSIFAIKPDWNHFFSAIGPNLAISDVTWNKKSYHAGDMAKITFNIVNAGTEEFSGSFDVVWREGEKPLDYYKNFYADLKPGESKIFDLFKSHPYDCDQPMFIEIDETNKVKETNKQDNTWQGVSACAPTTGPDLAVTHLQLQNPTYTPQEKWVGRENIVKYTIANIGSDLSVKTRALMKTTGGQYLALIDVPPLVPFFGNISGEVKYTPNDCSPIELDVDTENKNAETDKNNNYVTEPPAVTDHCLKGPDVSFGLLYWTSQGGYSFGAPHKNGETLTFHIEIANSGTDDDWGCAHNVQVGVYENDQLNTMLNFGNLGFYNCPDGGGVAGTNDHPLAVKSQLFYYQAKCGVTLKLVIDPNKLFSETDKSNNTWSRLIECQP